MSFFMALSVKNFFVQLWQKIRSSFTSLFIWLTDKLWSRQAKSADKNTQQPPQPNAFHNRTQSSDMIPDAVQQPPQLNAFYNRNKLSATIPNAVWDLLTLWVAI